MFCNRCGRQIPDDAIFCSWCGETIVRVQENPFNEAPAEPVAPEAEYTAPVQPEAPATDPDLREEQEFLDMTHRLLRWERKAWSITGKFALIFGSIASAVYVLIGIMALSGDTTAENLGMVCVMYGVIFALTLIPVGIISIIFANKIPQYLDTMYYDFEKTEKRSGSIGMLVLTVLFNEIAFIFFIINFVRIKSNGKLIERIKARQKNQ